MLEAVIGFGFAVLVAVGLLIMFGPNVAALRRLVSRRLIRKPEPLVMAPVEAGASPSTQRVISAAVRLGTMLRGNGESDLADIMRHALKRLQEDEEEGLLEIQSCLKRVRQVALGDERTHNKLHALARELRREVADRAEQLELILL